MADDFVIGGARQYQRVYPVAEHGIPVRGKGGTGLLLCHASHRPGYWPAGGRLLVAAHGATRKSAVYLGHAMAAAGPQWGTVVAPQFLADVDVTPPPGQRVGVSPPAGALYWSVEGWKAGRDSLGPVAVSSFTAMDTLLLARAWDEVVVYGNSGRGFVQRYAAVGLAPSILAGRGVPVRFVASNPSAYLYFDAARPVEVDHPDVNRWAYGFEDAPPYVQLGPKYALRQYLNRDVHILYGDQDSDPAADLLDVSPMAMAQGANRAERAIEAGRRLREMAYARHLPLPREPVALPGVGHEAGDVLAHPWTREILFGETR